MPKAWYGLALEFARLGHRVSILARSFPGQSDVERWGDLVIVRTRGFAQGRSLPLNLAKSFAYAMNVIPHLPRSDILVTNDFWVPALAGRFRKEAGAVVVCAARYPKGQYWLYSQVAKVVAISTAVRSAIVEERPALTERTIVIPLPIDFESLAGGERSKTPAKRTLLYAGRVHPEKGIELLLHSFARIASRFPEWRLKIVGPVAERDGGGGASFERSLRELARKLDVEFRGAVFDSDALAMEYRDADLFCYPSLAEHGEAFGVAALEAMAAGVPPIVSALACFRDFVHHGENGWVFDHRATHPKAMLAEVLVHAMLDHDGRKRLGERARTDASRYTYAAVAAQYLDEFERMLAARRAS